VCYWPSARRFHKLTADNLHRAGVLAGWRRGLQRGWGQVRVEGVEANGTDPMHVGSALEVKARVNLGQLSPEDVEVQLYHGPVDSMGEIPRAETVSMNHNGHPKGGHFFFSGTIPCRSSGQHGFVVRVLPRHGDLANPYEPGLVCWG